MYTHNCLIELENGIISFPSKEIDREKSLGNYPPARWKTSKDAERGEPDVGREVAQNEVSK